MEALTSLNAFDFTGVQTIAVDLVDTLVRRGQTEFVRSAYDFLKSQGLGISPDDFYTLYRKRYLEYSMGNYQDDFEFCSALFAGMPEVSITAAREFLVDSIVSCSPPFDDSSAFLSYASQHFNLVLSSNHVAGWAKRILESNHWSQFFAALVVSSDCRARKPSRRFYSDLAAAARAQSARDILVVGDSYVNDFYGAMQLGMRSVLVERVPREAAAINPAPITASSLLEVISHLAASSGQ